MAARGAEGGRYVVLDGMRGLAALCVITDHVDAGLLTAALPGRYLAVDFFFVLSGFVLSHVYGARLAAGMGVLGFMRVRLIRLYPLYIVGLLAGFSLVLVQTIRWGLSGAEALPVQFALNLFMLPAPTAVVFTFNGPAWSLFFELVANFAFAALLFRFPSRLVAGLAALGAVGLVASALHFGKLDGGWAAENFVVGFPRVFFGFFAGVLIHRLSQRRSLPALPSWAAYLLLIVLMAIPAIGPTRAWIDLAIIVVGCPLLVAISVNADGSGPVERALGWLGVMSYGIYILHAPMLAWLTALLGAFLPDVEIPGLYLFVATAVFVTLASAFLDKVYDTPVRRWLSRVAVARA